MAQRVALPYLSTAAMASESRGGSLNHQYTGSVGPDNTVLQGGPLPFPLSPGRQMELLERLKQLRAWQQQQQADLLRQQQEQLVKLRNEQSTVCNTSTPPGEAHQGSEGGVPEDGHVDSEKAVGDCGGPSLSHSPSMPNNSPFDSESVLSDENLECDDGGRELAGQTTRELDFDGKVQEQAIADYESGGNERSPDSDVQHPLPVTSEVPCMSRGAQQTIEERPVHPVVGDFEHFLEQQLKLEKSNSPGNDNQTNPNKPKKFSFLRRGEGIARFGVKQKKKKIKPNKSSQQKSSKGLSSSNELKLSSQSAKSNHVDPPDHGQVLSHSDQQLKVRKVARRGEFVNEPNFTTKAKSPQLSYPRMSTPTMTRCGSEDSFIVRRDDRVRREEEELLEFELLEMATIGDTPDPTSSSASSSQSSSSLAQAPPTIDVSLSTRSNHSKTTTQFGLSSVPHETPPTQPRPPGDISNFDIDSNLHVQLMTKQYPPQSTSKTNEPSEEDVPDLMSNQHWEHYYQGERTSDGAVEHTDLDETLTGPSLAAVDFNDEEEWHSFSQGSPQNLRAKDDAHETTPNGSMVSIEVGASWSPPIKREQLNEQGLPIFQSPLPTATLSSAVKKNPAAVVKQQHQHPLPPALVATECEPSSTLATLGSQNVTHFHASHHQFRNNVAGILGPPTSDPKPTTSYSSSSTSPGSVEAEFMSARQPGHVHFQQQLPPPSALVAKLFPALRREKRPLDLTVNSNKPKPPPGAGSPRGGDEASSPTSSAGGDSGKGSLSAGSTATSLMNEELRRKLCLLETEIERFKLENSTLEKLRVEKEEGLTHLKKEIAEFKRQKEEEMARFEEYKKEEIRKLKKERKMFETYQQQARTARDKKDKEDILLLRNELQELQEELRQRESRWGAAQSRLRLRIQNLEKENQELLNDLKMMEHNRLQLWQKQMEQEMEQANRKKERNAPKRETHDDQCVLDGYQSDGEDSDLSARTDEIVNQVLADDQSDDFENKPRSKSPSGELKAKAPSSNHIKRTASVEDGSKLKQKASNKHVDFALCPKKKFESASSSSKDGVRSSKQTKASPKKKGKPRSSPVKNRENQKVIQQRVRNHKEDISESSEEDGSRVILFPNGTRKIISPDGRSISVYFFNGDIKHVKPDHTVVYFYAESKTTHTTFSDGLELFEFPNGQCEKHFSNGTKEIAFPDKTLKYVRPDGEEETHFVDGTVQKVMPNGDMTMFYANGQKEIYTKDFKRREYPDGTVKTVYPDGRQETCYASGRVRVKDKEGRTLFDKLPVSDT